MSKVIEKNIELKAPIAKVWRALTDHREFGEWFQVNLTNPFLPNKKSVGHVTYPGYEHILLEMEVQKMEPEHHFSFTWHPAAIDPKIDYSQEKPTLVEFKLVTTSTGTRLTVVESGFDDLPVARRDEAFRMNEDGWAEQMVNIEKYLTKHSLMY